MIPTKSAFSWACGVFNALYTQSKQENSFKCYGSEGLNEIIAFREDEFMEYTLKNGKNVIIRKPQVEDAEAIIHVISTADTETPFLARNPGEFRATVEKEKQMIQNALDDVNSEWFVAEYEGKVVGQCSVGLVRRYARYRHRAEVAFVILKEYCNLGIGGKMMEECIQWCVDKGVSQMELDVVKDNERAVKMYRGFGFEICGIIPKALRYSDGTYADEYFMVKKLYSKCGMRCDKCLLYRPNVEREDRRADICNVYRKMFPGYNPDPATIICDGCASEKEEIALFEPNCKARKCVMEKGHMHCGYCENYPCDIFPAEPSEEEIIQKIEVEKQWTWEDEKLMEAYQCKKNMEEFRKRLRSKI